MSMPNMQINDQPINLWPDLSAPGSSAESSISFYPAQGRPSGASVIVCPGGGYVGLADHEAAPIAEWLAGHGIAAFVLRYRVAPNRHPASLNDARRAIRSVRYHATSLGLDPNRIAILGFSAGGHLAGMAATLWDEERKSGGDSVQELSARPDAAILIYPVTIMHGPFTEPGSLHNLLGDASESDLARSLTLPDCVTQATPPMFLVHASDDDVVHVENSLRMAVSLKADAVPFALHVFERGGHGFGLAQGSGMPRVWPDLCIEWLRNHGF